MAPHREEFARWRDDPVTRWVMRAHQTTADGNRDQWAKSSWESGIASQNVLIQLRAKAAAYLAIIEADYDDICAMLGEQPTDE